MLRNHFKWLPDNAATTKAATWWAAHVSHPRIHSYLTAVCKGWVQKVEGSPFTHKPVDVLKIGLARLHGDLCLFPFRYTKAADGTFQVTWQQQALFSALHSKVAACKKRMAKNPTAADPATWKHLQGARGWCITCASKLAEDGTHTNAQCYHTCGDECTMCTIKH